MENPIPVTEIAAIDVHGHYGDYHVDQFPALINQFHGADAATVLRRAELAHTALTIVSPNSGLMPIGKADVVAANEEADHTVQKNPGLLQYVIVNPLQPRTFEQAHDMLARPKCVGIKIHPEAHCYPIAEHEAVVLAHSGDENSWPADIVPLADAFPEASVILAHLGNGGRASGDPDLQVRALASAKHDNVYIDTSSARSLIPGLIEWAVAEVGVERLLYGTDTPCYYAPCQWARIAYTDLSAEQKRLILRDNAVKFFGLSD